ncbi:MAG: 23S rRNA pseudouridine synthase F [Tenericutes bacterium HGW-Tenericutes-1]|jgi:23S rRNA pseudouridine2604 synthase|nr:MAG: 23S rRNA pseudouridine synthase F [Tenericutes bacterium HGW-Tenericutes-1]
MRINVYISSTGYCSRREADRLIQAGKVTIDHLPAMVGMEVEETNVVRINGEIIGSRPKTIYLAFNKPIGIISTTDQTIKNNIIDYIKYPERIFPIGRLDKDTSGLILLTNDGMIVNEILRSENNHDKEYIVEVDKPYDEAFIKAMETGVEIYNPVQHEKTLTKPSIIHKINDKSFRLIITQGLNLQIRRMCQALGYRVISLKRIRIMNIELDELKTGVWRYLSNVEVDNLLKRIHNR